MGVEANWEHGDDSANVAWARDTVADLRQFSGGGGYLTFPGFFEEGEEQLRASHGEQNYERLVTLRAPRPGNLFGADGGIEAPSDRSPRPGLTPDTSSGLVGRPGAYRRTGTLREEAEMTQYGTLRTWAALLTVVGVLGMVAAAIGTLVWAFEVEGFWQTLGVLLIGGPVAIFLATLPIALGQALRALADVGDTVSAR